MDYNLLLDLVSKMGYRLAMSGAETFRIEESINRILAAYGLEAETFAIPNCLTISLKTHEGQSMTRMRRIGQHGNDLDAVERYSNLSRRICAPISLRISNRRRTSEISGTFSTWHTPLTSRVAGRMATAAFFAPEMETSPWSGCPPSMIYLIKKIPHSFQDEQSLSYNCSMTDFDRKYESNNFQMHHSTKHSLCKG